jgi:hypothetical protein
MLYHTPHVFWIEWRVFVPLLSVMPVWRPGGHDAVFRCALRRRQPVVFVIS